MTEPHFLIDVIVPVYNVEAYLEKCVDSLLAQDVDVPYCITLVDDGSIDGSPALCDRYASRYPEMIQVIHQKNTGQSMARNVGVENSAADYILFVDADDWVSERHLSSLYDSAATFSADIVLSSVARAYPLADAEMRIVPQPQIQTGILSREQALTEFCYEKHFSGFTVGKLVRRSIAMAHPFPKDKYYEDSFTTYHYLMDSPVIAYTSEVTYYYLQRPGSIQHSTFDHRHEDLLDAVSEMVTVFSQMEMPSAVQEAARYKICRSCYLTAFHAADLPRQEYLRVCERMAPMYRSAYKTICKARRVGISDRARFFLSLYLPRAFYRSVKISQRKAGTDPQKG